MVGKVKGLDPNVGGVRIKGAVRIFYSQKWQRWIAAAWPKPMPPATPAMKRAQADFKKAALAIKYATAEDVESAERLTHNTAWLTRDSLMANYFGTSIIATDETGMQWQGVRVLFPEVQGLLNSICDTVGAILVRDVDGWICLTPVGTTAGQLLTSNGAGVTPSWQDAPPAGVTQVTGVGEVVTSPDVGHVLVGLDDVPDGDILANISGGSAAPLRHTVSDVLDAVFGSTRGDILFRGNTHWNALASGSAGKFLMSNGSASDPSYEVVDEVPSIADGDLLANVSGGAALPTAQTLSALIDHVQGATRGEILYRGASAWTALALGSANKVLVSDGTDAAWQTVPGGSGYLPGSLPTIVQTQISNSGTDTITFGAAPTNGNLMVFMFFNPSTPNVKSGYVQEAFNTTGTDYGVIASRVAGASEPAAQVVLSSSPGGTGIICAWEIAGANGTRPMLWRQTQAEFTGLSNNPLITPNVPAAISLSAVSVVTAANIDATYNAGTLDQSILSSGNRRGAMGHSDLSAAPTGGIILGLSTSGNSKGCTCLIRS